jgi:hypothetical protein
MFESTDAMGTALRVLSALNSHRLKAGGIGCD